MAYGTGSEALWLNGAEELQQQPRRQRVRTFEVIEGEGLDARARQGVGTKFVANLIKIAIAASVLLVLGVSRVFVFSATVSVLKDNATMRAEIKTAQSTRADLEVQRSLLSSGTRIDRIATQNLGMVLASSGETIDVSDSFPKHKTQAKLYAEAPSKVSTKSISEVEGSVNEQVSVSESAVSQNVYNSSIE